MAVPTPAAMSRAMFLASKSASTSANLSFQGLDVAQQGLVVSAFLINLRALNPDTNSVSLTMRFSRAGAFLTAANYGYASYGEPMAGTLAAQSNGADNQAQILMGGVSAAATGTAWGTSGTVIIYDPAGTTAFPSAMWQCNQITGATTGVAYTGGGNYVVAGAIDGVQFFFSAGNITSGSVDIYALIAQ